MSNLPETTTISYLHPQGSFNLADHGVPTGREEFWRFTPVEKLTDFFDENNVQGSLPIHCVGLGALGSGTSLPTLGKGQVPRGTVLKPVDRTSAIAATTADASYLLIDSEVAEPIRLTIQGDDNQVLTANHLVIEAKPLSRATVILQYGGRARHIGNVEILVGDGAHLTVVSIQDWERGSVHLGQHEALVNKDSVYRHIVVTLGGDLVRIQNNVSYASQGGDAELLGVYFAEAGQHLEHRLFVDHNHPKGVSHVNYRGALQGEKATSVWVGDVLIRPAAQGIETYEANKNLVLTDGCRAEAVPNLEIETGNIVGAGHSASTGRFDEEQLFYLQSRGVDEAEARRLVVRGFFTTVLNKIGVEDVETLLMDKIDTELGFGSETGLDKEEK
ncbi:MAG: Fe-S cluster assembly protein SufD [Propionibacteriaceae bacterium]|jgi:Fe-S cluster assembly protein SufD|nr:Fe-S cluster assembly protein SufD [Propionibacteriaceae bacterium]